MTKRTQTIRRHVWTFCEKKNVKNKLPNKDTIIDYLLNEWITSKFSKSQESTDRSQSANIYESVTVDNSASDTIKDTNNEEKAAKKPRVVITGDLLLNDINEKGLLKDNHVEIKNFHGGTTETILRKVEELAKSKPDTLIVHAGTNDWTKGKIVLTHFFEKKLNQWKDFPHKQN